jgi:hypothetical protein
MIVWVEFHNGTKKIYRNVNRLVERGGNLEIRGGAGSAEQILMVHAKAEIKNFGNSATLFDRVVRPSAEYSDKPS